MTPKFLLPCTAWLTTFHALPRSDISDLTKLGSTFCLLTRKAKSSRPIFLSQEPHFVYSPEKAKAQDRSFLIKNLTLFTHPEAKAQDRSFLIKNLTLFTHPKDKSSRSIFLSQEPYVAYSPEKAKAQDRSFLIKNLSLVTHPKRQKLKIDLAYS